MLQLTLTTVSMHCMASACMDVTQLQPITLTDPHNNIENQVTVQLIKWRLVLYQFTFKMTAIYF